MENSSPANDFVIWPPYEAFYINAMLFNATQALKSAQDIHDVISAVENNPDLLQTLDATSCLNEVQNIAIHAAALSKYLWPVGKSYKARGEYLRKRLSVTDDSALSNRELRNQLEHLDEKLDDYFKTQVFSGYVFPEFFGPEPIRDGPKALFFRAYFIDSGEFEVLGKRYSIPALLSEIGRLHTELKKRDAQGARL
jgi:hypothetical protein